MTGRRIDSSQGILAQGRRDRAALPDGARSLWRAWPRFRYNSIVNEELAYNGVPAGFTLHSDIVCDYLVAYGSEEQKEQWLPRFVSGETITAIAMTEPGTGSDLQAIRTSAKKDGNHYVVNGSKTYITNGQNADLILVVAKTDPDAKPAYKGMSIILIESDREGFKRGRKLDTVLVEQRFFEEACEPMIDSRLWGRALSDRLKALLSQHGHRQASSQNSRCSIRDGRACARA